MPPPHSLLLQVTETTKEAVKVAATVSEHASETGLTALLWLLVILFGAALGLLIHKLIWKDRPVGYQDFVRLENDFNRLESAFGERKQRVDSDRMQDKLKFEGDLAAIVNSLQKLTTVAELQTTMAERINWHSKEFDRNTEEFKQIHSDLRSVQRDIDKINDKINRELPRT